MKFVLVFVLSILIISLSALIINVPTDQPTIQAGIDVAIDADTVLVQSGIYYENINFNGKDITVASHYLINQNHNFITSTIIDGNHNGSVVTFYYGETNEAKLIGFTIRNGKGDLSLIFESGGGITCQYASPYLEALIIKNNQARDNYGLGGGINIINSQNPVIKNCEVRENTAFGGAGLYCDFVNDLYLENVKFIQNSADHSGGGITIQYSSLSGDNLIFEGNSANQRGGGIIALDNNQTHYFNFNNVQFTNNSAEIGGAIYLWGVIGSFVNGTFSENTALEGSAVYCKEFSHPTFTNSIFWNNENEVVTFQSTGDENTISFQFCDLENIDTFVNTNNNGNCYFLYGNIDSNPFFQEAGEYSYSLQFNSPCINIGTPDISGMNLPETDLAGNPRVYDDIIDLGGYEWQGVEIENNDFPIFRINLTNYPNPFNPTTTIKFSIQSHSKVNLSIFNIKGQLIKTLANNEFTQGLHSIIWNGDDKFKQPVSSGIYYYNLNVNGKSEVIKKCLLLK